MRRLLFVVLSALPMLAMGPAPAEAHGDVLLVDDVLVLHPGETVAFDGELHYHRVVGRLDADGDVRVRFAAFRDAEDVRTLGTGSELSFNELVRCCDEPWTPYTLLVDNIGEDPVTVVARVMLVHDDLAVMVDGAESGTRASMVLLGFGWAVLLWRARRRQDHGVPLRRPAFGLALLAAFVLGIGTWAQMRYGVGGAPSVVAGNADVPLLPFNPAVSRASVLMGLSMVGFALVGSWWVRARARSSQMAWTALGIALVGAVVVVAAAVTAAYGNPLVQAAWVVAGVGPLAVVLFGSLRPTAASGPAASSEPAPGAGARR